METRTNIVLDDALVERAMAKAGVSTKKAAIEAALRAFVREPDWDLILAMEGSRAVADDYDPAALFAAESVAVMEPDAAYRAVPPRSADQPAGGPARETKARPRRGKPGR